MKRGLRLPGGDAARAWLASRGQGGVVERLNASRRYASQLAAYRAASPAEDIAIYPRLFDATSETEVDAHYFFMAKWAVGQILEQRPAAHVDISSDTQVIAALSSITLVHFVDIRPPNVRADGLSLLCGSVTALPFATGSVGSLSCMHVVEHVGLARYGDALDPAGSAKALRELERVVAPGGRLLLAIPVGRQRTFFNAHRVFAPTAALEAMPSLQLRRFSWVDDKGVFHQDAQPADAASAGYACGMYALERPS